MSAAPRRLLFFAYGFPPAAKSSAYRLREIANQFAALGWEVTVVNGDHRSWEDDNGLDLSMLAHVDPRVRVVELPLRRKDLETDIRTFSKARAEDPVGWVKARDRKCLKVFPEVKFGSWRHRLEEVALRLHREQPFDLVVASCTPYVFLAPALRLHEEYGVPYAVDFRDGWSIDVLEGEVAFAADSAAGRWEARALEHALSLWVVNEPIAEHYRGRYPHLRERVHVVRNGFDADSVPTATPAHDPGRPLRFGYLGTVNFSLDTMAAVLAAWRAARDSEPLLAHATVEIRGHVGASWVRGANPMAEMIREARPDGVVLGGPVPKAEVGSVYASWDALLLILVGGRYVTSGKVYEFMATGLPILSVHEREHDASNLLRDYPLWVDVQGMEGEQLASSFARAARMVRDSTPALHEAARTYATRFDRARLMSPAVQQLVATASESANTSGRAR